MRAKIAFTPTDGTKLPLSYPKVMLGIYAQVIASKTDHGAALDELVGGPISAPALRTRAGLSGWVEQNTYGGAPNLR